MSECDYFGADRPDGGAPLSAELCCDFFEAPASARAPARRTTVLDASAILGADVPRPPPPVRTLAEFVANLRSLSGGVVGGDEFAAFAREHRVAVAGGACVAALAGSARSAAAWSDSDVDMFFVGGEEGHTDQQAAAAVEAFAFLLARAKAEEEQEEDDDLGLLVLLRTAKCVSFWIHLGGRWRSFQLVLRGGLRTLEQVLIGFDIDCARVGFDGERCVAAHSAVRALAAAINVVDPTVGSDSFEFRLMKYLKRGFAIGIPGLEAELISDTLAATLAEPLGAGAAGAGDDDGSKRASSDLVFESCALRRLLLLEHFDRRSLVDVNAAWHDDYGRIVGVAESKGDPAVDQKIRIPTLDFNGGAHKILEASGKSTRRLRVRGRSTY